MQIFNSKGFKLIVVLFFALQLFSFSALASDEHYELKLKIREQKALVEELSKITNFSNEARKWFILYSKKDRELKKLKQKQGTFYENKQIKYDIDQLTKELKALRNLNGKTIKSYSNKNCTNIDELYTEFIKGGHAAKVYTKDLSATHDQINKILDKLKELKQEDNNAVKLKIETKRIMLVRYNDILSNNTQLIYNYEEFDPSTSTDMMKVKFVDKDVIVADLIRKYQRLEPKERDRRVMEDFNFIVTATMKTKNVLSQRFIPQLKEEIKFLREKLKEKVQELTGCWKLVINKRASQIMVNKDDYGTYHGVFSKVDKLKYFKAGHKLFQVQRQSNNSFKGYENSFKNDGTADRGNITITIDESGDFLRYYTTGTYTMYRCGYLK